MSYRVIDSVVVFLAAFWVAFGVQAFFGAEVLSWRFCLFTLTAFGLLFASRHFGRRALIERSAESTATARRFFGADVVTHAELERWARERDREQTVNREDVVQ